MVETIKINKNLCYVFLPEEQKMAKIYEQKNVKNSFLFTEIPMNATETKCSHKILFNSFNCEIKMKVWEKEYSMPINYFTLPLALDFNYIFINTKKFK